MCYCANNGTNFWLAAVADIEAYLRRETPDLTKRDAWLIMNCADTNNDKVMTFDEFSARPSL